MDLVTTGWIIGSIFSSTTIILLNKHIMTNFGFDSPVFLTTYHFFLTWGLLEIMCIFKYFERGTHIPKFEVWKMAAYGVGAVVFMNFNLKLNSVGFYQLSKLCCVPFMVVYDLIVLKKSTPLKIIYSLLFLLVGIGLFSINDVQLNLIGSIIAIIAVFCVSIFQIFTGSKQKQFNVGGNTLQHATALPQTILALLTGLFLETSGDSAIYKQRYDSNTLPQILLTGLVAVSVNICSFGLIGKTSAVTYQVVGHIKTILIFIFGLIYFPPNAKETLAQKNKKIIGLCISMVGVISYTYFKLTLPNPIEEKKDKENKNDNNQNDEIPLLKENEFEIIKEEEEEEEKKN